VGSSGKKASVTQTNCTISGAVIAPVSPKVLKDFNSAYTALGNVPCEFNLTGQSLAGQILPPGVYCFDAAVAETDSVLTLNGSSTDIWIFQIGTDGTGALTGTNFSVLFAEATGGQPCNVYWWVAQGATMTTSGFQGTILAGAAITITGLAVAPTITSFNGDALAKAAVTLTNVTVTGCEQAGHQAGTGCNQGVGNGPEGCDPGNSNQGDPSRSNDEPGGTPGNPGRKGGNGK
jgi:hypothetical protein